MTISDIREILGVCSLINIVLMTISFFMLSMMHDWVYRVHSKFFPITESQFNIAIYSFMGLYKVLVIVFNIVPWIACSIPTWF